MASNQPREERLVHALNPNDVILGRGQHLKNEGNTRFRTLVRSRVDEYTACESKTAKDAVARRIVMVIENMGGRFVSRVDGDSTADPNSEETPVWEVAVEKTILIKVKQTFRDYTVIRKKAAAAAVAAVARTSAPNTNHAGFNHTTAMAYPLPPRVATFSRPMGSQSLPNSLASMSTSTMLGFSSGWDSGQRQELLQALLLQQLERAGSSSYASFGRSNVSLLPPIAQSFVGQSAHSSVVGNLPLSQVPTHPEGLPPAYNFANPATVSRGAVHPNVTDPTDNRHSNSSEALNH